MKAGRPSEAYDPVVVRWRARATHKGDGLGIPAIGRPVDTTSGC
jgi:hypothetical protein